MRQYVDLVVTNEDNETASLNLNVSENAFVYASQGETKRVCQEMLPLLVWCMAVWGFLHGCWRFVSAYDFYAGRLWWV